MPLKRKATESFPAEVDKMRFDYAWKWFAFHAEQRTKMFHFMLIVLGIFATAIATAVDKKFPIGVTTTLCIIAAALAAIFGLLDRRNSELLSVAEEVLADLERDRIFGEDTTILDRKDREIPYGILWRQSRDDKEKGYVVWRSVIGGRHRIWMRAVSVVLVVLFLVAAVLINCAD